MAKILNVCMLQWFIEVHVMTLPTALSRRPFPYIFLSRKKYTFFLDGLDHIFQSAVNTIHKCWKGPVQIGRNYQDCVHTRTCSRAYTTIIGIEHHKRVQKNNKNAIIIMMMMNCDDLPALLVEKFSQIVLHLKRTMHACVIKGNFFTALCKNDTKNLLLIYVCMDHEFRLT